MAYCESVKAWLRLMSGGSFWSSSVTEKAPVEVMVESFFCVTVTDSESTFGSTSKLKAAVLDAFVPFAATVAATYTAPVVELSSRLPALPSTASA